MFNKTCQIWMIILLCGVLSSCSTELQPIAYNEDQCDFCKMIISDRRFGAELVSTKGKVFKYDAAECMFRVLTSEGEEDYARQGVTFFNLPGQLQDATSAWYLVSEKRPSPMGASLSAYASREEAEAALQQLGGQMYSYDEVLENFNN